MLVKIPVTFKDVDSSKLTEKDVDQLLIAYNEIGKIVKLPFTSAPPPIKEEIIKILGIKIECDEE